MFNETSDTFRVGEVGSLQAVATREDAPTSTRVPWWNDTAKRFDTLGNDYIEIDIANNDITFNIADTLEGQFDANGLTLKSGASVNEFSIDGTLAGNSDDAVPTEQAVKTYVDDQVVNSQINVRSISADSTAVTSDVVLVNTAATDITVDVQESVNARISVKKTSADANTVIITATGTIDGAATLVLDTQYQAFTLVCDGTNWHII